MAYSQPIPPEAKTAEAAYILGQNIRSERGNAGLRAYLSLLGELFGKEWTDRFAARFDTVNEPAPRPVPHPTQNPQSAPMPAQQPMPEQRPPQEQRQNKPDMEKAIQLMQLMGNLRT